MSNLVCIGKTYELRGDDTPDPVHQPGDTPKQPQKVRQIKREYMSIVPAIRTKHNGYRPGKIIDICTDQCRFSVSDGIFCGVKVLNGKSWCAEHYAIVHGRFMEAAE